MMKTLINLFILSLPILIIWWFWLGTKSKPKVLSHGTIKIIVDSGIYQPSIIRIRKNEKISLEFTRYDASPCAEMVVFPELNMSRELPLNKAITIDYTPEKTGEFEFTCAMGMYRGKLIVEE